MPSICFYFQVHQPFRLKKYTYLNVGHDHNYFDEAKNAEILRKVSHKCYLPANKILLDLIKRTGGQFRVAFSISGTVIEQMKLYCPEALESFRALAQTGCVEFLAETYYHSLSSLYSKEEFFYQVRKHTETIEKEFGVVPKVFRNTELIYSDSVGKMADELGFGAILAEGVDRVLGDLSTNHSYNVVGSSTRILLKNYRLSDDIAFRFSNPHWEGYPLTPEKFSLSICALESNAEVVGLFMDYETFGEHQWESTGIFDFLKALPETLLGKGIEFLTPSEILTRYSSVGELPCPQYTSWADLSRDVTAWNGNGMQSSALNKIYLEKSFPGSKENSFNSCPEKIETWRKLQASDHFYYMSTKSFGDGAVHSYFSPYETPYDAFITYMNVMRDFQSWIALNESPSAAFDTAIGV